MRRLYKGVVSTLALGLAIGATQANAQALRGVRVEADTGISSWHSEGASKSKWGWGAAAGVDAYVGGNFVLGAEGTFWYAPADNRGVPQSGGIANHKTFQEWGIAARAGVELSPGTLVYAKGGWVTNEQRKEFVPYVPAPGGGFNVGGASTPGYYYDHRNHPGYVLGGGIEQNLSSMFYVKAEGRYSRYNDHTHTLTGLVGLGVLFGASREEAAAPPPPPPPPPPPAPATQTCPDGSVIDATAACPAPPPPPPPPPPPATKGERG